MMIRLADKLDRLLQAVGAACSWATCVLVLVIVAQVVMRNVFKHNLVVLEELQWHLYALAAMGGLSYAHSQDSHVRVDLFSSRFSARAKAVIEIIGIFLFVLPFFLFLLWLSIDFVRDAYMTGERSDVAGGLPYRWIVKSFIPAGSLLVIVACCSSLLRRFAAFRERREDDS